MFNHVTFVKPIVIPFFVQGKLEAWEEQIGVRLALRLIDSVC